MAALFVDVRLIHRLSQIRTRRSSAERNLQISTAPWRTTSHPSRSASAASASVAAMATIETAAEIFERDVLGPAGESPGGLSRVLALSEAFLRHLERRVFPGGCFFATVAVQLASRPGRPRDRVMELQKGWLEQFAEALGQAVAGGELPRDTDIDQLVFEITAMMVRANFTWIVTGETRGRLGCSARTT